MFPLDDFVSANKDAMLANKFIFLHFPRTGGSTLRRVLPQLPGGHREISWAHAPYDFYAGLCALLNLPIPPAFTFVRNPWAWYVSQWLWQMQARPDCPQVFGEWMEHVKINAEKGLSAQVPEAAVNACPMSFAWEYMQCDKADYVGCYEDYENEVVRILLSILNGDLEALIRAKIASAGRVKRTKWPPGYVTYQDFYTSETKQWVAEWDRVLIGRFSYSFKEAI